MSLIASIKKVTALEERPIDTAAFTRRQRISQDDRVEAPVAHFRDLGCNIPGYDIRPANNRLSSDDGDAPLLTLE